MQKWKEYALGLYYWASLPRRRRAAAQRAAFQTEPLIVLYYHRVADEFPNDWTIGTATFEEQLDWLADCFDFVSLAEGQSRIAAGKNRWPSVCITFDDGYADNCEFAIPLLLRRQIPFTYFVSWDHVAGDLPFPHDVETGEILKPNTLDEIRALARAGVDIGSHGRSHIDLGRVHDRQLLVNEIAGSKLELESAIGKEVHHFAFPYGLHENLTQTGFAVAREAGYRAAVSAYGGYNFPGEDSFHLQRIHGDPQMVRFKNWLTMDPRKQTIVERFDAGCLKVDHGAEPLHQQTP